MVQNNILNLQKKITNKNVCFKVKIEILDLGVFCFRFYGFVGINALIRSVVCEYSYKPSR